MSPNWYAIPAIAQTPPTKQPRSRKAAFFNAILIFTTFLISLPALVLPSNRSWLRTHGWLVLSSGLFTLVLGLFIWMDTLRTRSTLLTVWAEQTPVVQSLLQQKACVLFKAGVFVCSSLTERFCGSSTAVDI